MDDAAFHVPAGAGPLADLGGLGVHFKLSGAQTGGGIAVVEHPIAPGVLVEPHVHSNEDELSYVLEGTVWARVGDREVEAGPGSYVWKPRGVLHSFWNAGPEPARLLEVITPAGLERFFDELGTLLGRQPEPDEALVYELCGRYGLSFDRSWVPGIEARFGPMQIV